MTNTNLIQAPPEDEGQDLIDLPAVLTPEKAFTPNGCDFIIEAIRQRVTGVDADASTEEGRRTLKSLAYKVSKSKTAIERIAHDFVEEKKNAVKAIDAERLRVSKALDALRDEVKAPAVAWEQAEEERKNAMRADIAVFNGFASLVFSPALQPSALQSHASQCEALFTGREWFEFQSLAESAFKAAVNNLKILIIDLEKHLAEQAERQRQEAEKAKAEQEARDKRIADEAASKAAQEATAAANRAAQAAIDEANRQARAAQAALEAKQAAEKAEQAAQAKRDADLAHRANIETKVIAVFCDLAPNMSVEDAASIVLAIAAGTVPHVKIQY